MHIHELIIDGFKSYATRTVVSGFDRHFNAITGLNGSGKSNILDSICFVLGISNLSQVRAGNLQELVYKQGQAGVTKATVSIIFDNSDPAGSPVGYESHKQITVSRQVVIGGKNKYMINGVTCQQSQVQNLFHSVQLNVNNPHFLIMQGRITKVLNMKPPETLGMIEEAAGTRMFETKKLAALKTIEKKDAKVNELTACMDGDITPKLDRLRSERANYLSWSQNNTELVHMERFCAAHEYSEMNKRVTSGEGERVAQNALLQACSDAEDAHNASAEQLVVDMANLARRRDDQSSGAFKELQDQEGLLSKAVVKAEAAVSNHDASLARDRAELAVLIKQHKGIGATRESKQVELEKCESSLARAEAEAAESEASSAVAMETYQNAMAGKVGDEGGADTLSLPEQVGHWEEKAREAGSQLTQGKVLTKHLCAELKELAKAKAVAEKHESVGIRQLQTLEGEVAALEDSLAALDFSERAERDLHTRADELQVRMAPLRDSTEKLGAQLEARLAFDFSTPEKGFDRSRVKGLVARLVTVTAPSASTALEITAGAKLYQVVVDNETTGKLLLEKGKLRKRVTILPLNKLNSRVTDSPRVNKAKEIAATKGGTANLALELVGYDDEVLKAVQHCFGATIICDRPDIAEAIAFHPQVRNKTVTLDGDSYDPSGTLTGGSKANLGETLHKLQRLHAQQTELDALRAELKAVQTDLKTMTKGAMEAEKLASKLDIKRHELNMCRDKASESTYTQTAAEMSEKEAKLAELEKDAVVLKEAAARAKHELAGLKDKAKDIQKARDAALSSMEVEMKAAQKASGAAKTAVAGWRKKRDMLHGEIASADKESANGAAAATALEEAVAAMELQGRELRATLTRVQGDHGLAQSQTAAMAEGLAALGRDLKALDAKRDTAVKAANDASLEVKKLAHKLRQFDKECKDAVHALAALAKAHSWIADEHTSFGVAGGDFDFAATDMKSAYAKLKSLRLDQEQVSKKINKKVMGMIEKAEAEYQDLKKKRDVILHDKDTIQEVITELELKKSQALQTVWVKVNRDFGSIFSTLLPGTNAKLEPLEGCKVEDGLEVKVAFNNVWKESLTELSGGQRSLLALSLILSLLLFKPAPMYILDEVDAALDLSHTQNIGMMLRTHFAASQFIVVSLKEGMFNNANVIFRTRFVDGISQVSRTVLGNKKQLAERAANSAAQEEEEASAPTKAKTTKTKTKTTKTKAGRENVAV